jgi:hypothetical protein
MGQPGGLDTTTQEIAMSDDENSTILEILDQPSPNFGGERPDQKRFPVDGLRFRSKCKCGKVFDSGVDTIYYPEFGKPTKFETYCPDCEEPAEGVVILHAAVTVSLVSQEP